MKVVKMALLLGAIFFCFYACQEENVQISEANTQETLVVNDTLPRLMERVAMLDGSADNFIDNAHCFTVDLPVTISIHGILTPITSETLYADIIDFINQFENGPSIDITFPITLIAADYTEIVIENEEELIAQASICSAPNTSDLDIECIDFQYPFSIAIFDVNFEVTETIAISSDEELFTFLQTLDDGIIASVNYPINLINADGSVSSVNSNEELETAIAAADDTCDEDDDNNFNDVNCTEAQVSENLQSCFWKIEDFGGNEELVYEFNFNEDGTFTFTTDPTNSTVYTGNWEVAISQGSLVLNISSIIDEFTTFNGSWIIDECEENQLIIHSGNQEVTLQKVCENETPFECFQDLEITVCDEENPFDGFVAMDLEALFIANISCTQEYNFGFYQTLPEAQASFNPVIPSSYTNITAYQQTLYLRIEDVSGNFEIYIVNINIEECCTNDTVLTENLVLYIPFANETKDLVSNWEASGNYNYVADRAGNSNCALAFNGNESVEIPISTSNQIIQGDAFSVSLWFKMQNTNPSNYEILFQKGSSVSEGFQISVFDLNTPVFSDADSGYGLWDDPWNMDANLPTDTTNWHHLVITVDENNTVRLYRDGIQRNEDINAGIDIGNTPLMNYILGNGFEGHLDDVRVYKTALTPNQVTTLFNLEADCNNCL